jgi:hypothetical protein
LNAVAGPGVRPPHFAGFQAERNHVREGNEDRRSTARRKAQNHFTSTEQRDALLRKELENERAISAAKRARLQALRLAKEAEDRAAAAPVEAAQQVKKRRAAPRKRPQQY